MRREYYSDTIAAFLGKPSDQILGELQRSNNLDSARLERTQSEAWDEQIRILKDVLEQHRRVGKVYFEYSIPDGAFPIPERSHREKTFRLSAISATGTPPRVSIAACTKPTTGEQVLRSGCT